MIEDERHYHQLALNVLHEHGFGWKPETPTSIRPPLYPFFEGLVWKITGTESILYVPLAQIGLSLLAVYLLYRLGLLVFDQPIARLAAAGVWLYPSLVAFNFLLLTEILFTCLLTLVALGYVTLLARTGRAAGQNLAPTTHLDTIPKKRRKALLEYMWPRDAKGQSARSHQASIMASATPFCFCTTQKHLLVKIVIISMVYDIIFPIPL